MPATCATGCRRPSASSSRPRRTPRPSARPSVRSAATRRSCASPRAAAERPALVLADRSIGAALGSGHLFRRALDLAGGYGRRLRDEKGNRIARCGRKARGLRSRRWLSCRLGTRRYVKEDNMSEFPTPRLGRAVRLFTPVVLAGALAVPMLSPAKEHGKKAHQKGNVPAAQAPDTNVIVTPSNPADDNPAAGADDSVGQSQGTTTVPADDSTSSNIAADDSSSSN